MNLNLKRGEFQLERTLLVSGTVYDFIYHVSSSLNIHQLTNSKMTILKFDRLSEDKEEWLIVHRFLSKCFSVSPCIENDVGKIMHIQ